MLVSEILVLGIINDVIFESEITSSLTNWPHVCVRFALIFLSV